MFTPRILPRNYLGLKAKCIRQETFVKRSIPMSIALYARTALHKHHTHCILPDTIMYITLCNRKKLGARGSHENSPLPSRIEVFLLRCGHQHALGAEPEPAARTKARARNRRTTPAKRLHPSLAKITDPCARSVQESVSRRKLWALSAAAQHPARFREWGHLRHLENCPLPAFHAKSTLS